MPSPSHRGSRLPLHPSWSRGYPSVRRPGEAVTILGVIDGLHAGADDVHAAIGQGLGQIDGGLSAQRGDDALGLLKFDDVEDILGSEGLEVQLVGGGEDTL